MWQSNRKVRDSMSGHEITFFIPCLMGGTYLAFPFAYLQLSNECEEVARKDNGEEEPDRE